MLVPSYRKHKASGQAFVEINGRQFYLGPHGTKASTIEYDRLVAEYLTSGRSTSYGTPDRDVTIVELAADYLAFAKQRYGAGKGSEYYRMLRVVRTLKQLYGRTPAVEFGPRQLKAVRQQFIDEGCSRSFTNASMQRVLRVFRWGARGSGVQLMQPAERPTMQQLAAQNNEQGRCVECGCKNFKEATHCRNCRSVLPKPMKSEPRRSFMT
jgi:hypothetical protein